MSILTPTTPKVGTFVSATREDDGVEIKGVLMVAGDDTKSAIVFVPQEFRCIATRCRSAPMTELDDEVTPEDDTAGVALARSQIEDGVWAFSRHQVAA